MKAYTVGYSVGSYDDYREVTVFITLDKKKATRWCTKFNKMMKKWKLYYDQYTKDVGLKWYDADKYGYKFYARWHELYKLNSASYNEYEIR